jgi:hypothetical protein
MLPDAPRYRRGIIIAASCAIAAGVVILIWKLLYRLFDGGDAGVETKHDAMESRLANQVEA